MHLSRARIVLLMFVATAAVAPAAHAVCNNVTLNGIYGVLATGLNGSNQPIAAVNRVVFDGAGHLSGSSTKSQNGTLVTYNFTGTYQIAANCTGTAVHNNQDGNPIHENIYLDNGDKGAFLIQTDDQHVVTGVLVAQGAATCTDLGVKRTYAAQFTGVVPSQGQVVAASGQLKLNGTGSITGTLTISVNGSIGLNLPVTGTYQINSDCTGTAQVTPHGLSPNNLALLTVNAGKEIMAIQTDANTIIAGTLQQ